MLYPELFKQLEAVRWNMHTDIPWDRFDASQLSDEQKKAIMQEGNQIYLDMIAQLENPPESEAVQAIVARWHQHTRHFYEPTFEILRGLGQGYATDPAFRATFEAMHPDLPDFLQAAITVYCDKNTKT